MKRRQHLWHPFARMSSVIDAEVVIERGEGVWVYDSDGGRYLDCSAGLWYCNVGHGRAAIADAAAEQMRRIAGYQLFDRFANPPALALAERIAELAPMEEAAVFFTSGGSDAIDSAAKIARRYWDAQGAPQRSLIVSRDGAYHGMNAYGTSLAGISANRAGWGTLVRDTVLVPRDDAEAFARLLEERPGEVAAFIGEPVQGAAGVYPPRPGYWRRIQELCRAHDVLLIADEVVTGFGRLGSWFACERYGIEPDMLTVAKGLSSGYLPIGAVVASSRLTKVLWAAEAGYFRHGYTYSGHPAACAAALANLAIIEDEELLAHAARMEPVLAQELGSLAGHELVAEVRTVGMLGGVELSEATRAADPEAVERVVAGARRRGVLVRNLLGRALQVSPPLTIGAEELRFVAAVLGETLDELRVELHGAAREAL